MTSAQVVETSVTVTDNSPFQDYPHPDDHTTQSNVHYVSLALCNCMENYIAQFTVEKVND